MLPWPASKRKGARSGSVGRHPVAHTPDPLTSAGEWRVGMDHTTFMQRQESGTKSELSHLFEDPAKRFGRHWNWSGSTGSTGIAGSAGSEAIMTDVGSESISNVRYARFTLGGIPGEKHAVFISDRAPIGPETFPQICQALGIEPPSATICGVGPLCHPGAMVTPELRACSDFQTLVSEGRRSLGLPDVGAECGLFASIGNSLRRLTGSTCGGYQSLCQEPQDDMGSLALSRKLDRFVDRVFEKRCVSMVGSIEKAAHSLNAWVLTFPGLTTFEALLQLGGEAGDEDKAVKAVVAHLQDRAYMQHSRSKEMLQRLFDSSEPLSSAATGYFAPVELPGDIWDPKKNGMNSEFQQYGFDYWSFSTTSSSRAHGHPTVAWPWHCGDIYFFFYREEENSCGVKADWNFQTQQNLDSGAIPFEPEMLAPPAYVFIDGEGASKKKIMQVMKFVRPTIVFDNTQGMAKQISLLLNMIKSALQPSAEACKQVLRDGVSLPSRPTSMDVLKVMSPSKILQRISLAYDCSRLQPDSRLTLSDVVFVLDLVRARPVVFKESLCVLDPLQDSPEDSVRVLASTLCSSHVGSAEEAHSTSRVIGSLVLRGWGLHRKLFNEEKRLRSGALYMELATAACVLLATVAAAVAVQLRLESARVVEAELASGKLLSEGDAGPNLDFALAVSKLHMLLLPAFAAMTMVSSSHFQFSQRHGQAHHAAATVAAEIFAFLGGVGRYASPDMEVNRWRFSRRLEELGNGAQAAGMETTLAMDRDELQQHVEESMYGLKPRGWFCRAVDCLGSANERREHCREHIKDFTSMLTSEMYIDIRMAPLTWLYRDQVSEARRLRSTASACMFLLLSAIVALAVLSFTLWIPVVVAAAVCLAVFGQHHAPDDQVEAASIALAELNRLDMRWNSLTVREQRDYQTKRHLINRTEKVMLAVAANVGRLPAHATFEEENEAEAGDDFDEVIELSGTCTKGTSTPRSGLSTPRRMSSKSMMGNWRNGS